MGKMVIKESELKGMIGEAIRRIALRESFASSALKREIEKMGGFNRGSKCVTSWSEENDYGLVGILDKLTDEGLLYRAMHLDEFPEKMYVRCMNGDLVIPLSYEEYREGNDAQEMRNDRMWDEENPEYSEDGAVHYRTVDRRKQEKYDNAIGFYKGYKEYGDEGDREKALNNVAKYKTM